MSDLDFKIRGMDCVEEVILLKRELSPLVGGEANLVFDVLAGKLTVLVPNGEPVTADVIIKAVARTGLEALPWRDWQAAQRAPLAADGFWKRRGRLVSCLASGLLVALGFAIHAGAHGLVHSLAGAEASGARLPLPARLCFLGAIAAGGCYIAPRALLAARRLRPDMNLLMSVAVLGALALGEWFEAASVTFLFAFALLLESWSVGRARRAIRALVDLTPPTARHICPHDGDVLETPVEEVPVGAIVLVRPGERIPLDGILTRGTTSVNEAPLTGESLPVVKEPGAEVFAGTINGDGAIELRATRPAADTTLARIIHMVEQAQARRAPSERWVERFARIYTPAMMWIALGIAVVPPLIFGAAWNRWIYEALVLLVIACPCALVISTPMSIVAGLTTAARAGVLIKGGAFLELPARLRAIALDKTGTLTLGRPEVTAVVTLDGDHTPELILGRAAALEAQTAHLWGRAILRRAASDGLTWAPAQDLVSRPGRGAEGQLDGRRFWIGSHRFMHEKGSETPAVHARAEELERAGHSVVALGSGDHVCGLIGVTDPVRPEAAPVVRALHAAGIGTVVMLTGDHEGTARAIAEAAAVDSYAFDLLPADKARRLEALAREHGPVAMVGDGVNDAPAMAAAALGIAMGAAGSDAAIETADVALMADDLTKLPWLVRHSRRTMRVIRENVAFALAIKATFLTLALTGVATLWMAIAADMGASLLVIFNSLRLLDDRRAAAPRARGSAIDSMNP